VRHLILRAIAAALISVAPAAAAPTPALVETPGGALLHSGTGLALPSTLGPLKRQESSPESPRIFIYVDGREADPLGHYVTVAIDRVTSGPTLAQMRERGRAAMARDGKVVVVTEGAFLWPGQPKARSFRGRYRDAGMFKEVWSAVAGRTGILVLVTARESDAGEIDRLSEAVGREIFGGAATEPTP
jgi:hypothetical protein